MAEETTEISVPVGRVVRAPSIGRIVHYMALGSADGKFPPTCRAAIVADVHSDDNPANVREELAYGVPGNDWVTVCVLNPKGIFFDVVCQDDFTKTPGTWHWPELV